jgi:type I restriction enzyme S subunit
MEVKSGYKQPKVGVIPEKWEVKTLGEIAEITMGQSPDSKYYNCVGNGVPLIQGNADIENHRSIARVWTTQITKTGRANDLLLTVRAPVGAVGRISESSCLGRGVCSLRPKGDSDFLFHTLAFAESSWKVIEQGSTFTSANSTQVAAFSLSMPIAISEQRAIAKTLNDMDELLSRLGRLIAKKRDLKQAAMQQLLTGQTRLPGFHGKWEWLRLQKIVDFANGKPHEGDIKANGEYLLITLDSIGADGCLKAEHKRVSRYDDSLKKNDIVTVLSTVVSNLDQGNILGLSDLIPTDNKYVLNQRMGRLRMKVNGSPRFVCLQMNRSRDHFKQRGQGTSQKHIYKRDIDSLVIPFPSPTEQTAIAEVLVEMDAELAALEQRREKTHALKQAMMQELLTGKTRLV